MAADNKRPYRVVPVRLDANGIVFDTKAIETIANCLQDQIPVFEDFHAQFPVGFTRGGGWDSNGNVYAVVEIAHGSVQCENLVPSLSAEKTGDAGAWVVRGIRRFAINGCGIEMRSSGSDKRDKTRYPSRPRKRKSSVGYCNFAVTRDLDDGSVEIMPLAGKTVRLEKDDVEWFIKLLKGELEHHGPPNGPLIELNVETGFEG